MKKIFLATIFCLTMIFSAAVNAQDVYATSKNGFDYYVVSETVSDREYNTSFSDGKNHHVTEVTGEVKKIRGGKLFATENWRFVSVDYHRWQYFINGERHGAFNTIEDVYASEILSAMNTKHWK